MLIDVVYCLSTIGLAAPISLDLSLKNILQYTFSLETTGVFRMDGRHYRANILRDRASTVECWTVGPFGHTVK
jgi:hypothetical protein